MIQLTQLTDNLIAVCVENDTKHFYISGKYLCWTQGTVSCICRELPKGNYTILGELIGGERGSIYKFIDKNHTPITMELLQSKGCILNADNKFIILKRTNHE